MNSKELLKLEVLSRKYDEANIPQYLSYPTTNWWKSGVNEESFSSQIKGKRIPYLYFHFPFCQKACYYCMCYRKIAADELEKERYLLYLQKEIAQKTALLDSATFTSVEHIHWGGGTPTLLTCSQIEKMFQVITKHVHLSNNPSLSIEAYPDEEFVTAEKLALLRSLGFNQISFGVQDFDPLIQQVIGRDGKIEVVARLVEQSKSLGFRVNIDLCYGLPFQGQNELTRTVEEVLKLSPDKVVLLAYSHYPMIFPMQRKIPTSSIPNSFVRILLAMQAEELFLENGYFKIGYDHFVKASDPLLTAARTKRVIRDFMGYSIDKKKEFIGFGISAISSIENTYYHNVSTFDKYFGSIDNKVPPLEYRKCHALSADDRIRNRIIQKDILSDFVIEKENLEQRWDMDFNCYFNKEMDDLSNLEANGLVDLRDPGKVLLTSIGKHFARHVAYAFDKYYNYHSRSLLSGGARQEV